MAPAQLWSFAQCNSAQHTFTVSHFGLAEAVTVGVCISEHMNCSTALGVVEGAVTSQAVTVLLLCLGMH